MTAVLKKEEKKATPQNGSRRNLEQKESSFRLQLVLPQNSMDRLEGLKASTEAASYAEVIRRALSIYESLVIEAGRGGQIVLRSKNADEEVIPLKFV